MTKIICNAFSLQMLDLTNVSNVLIEPVDIKDVVFDVSAVGHADTANVLTDMLGVNVECNRSNVKLDSDTTLFVAQVIGGRLPEGATTLPEGFTITFVKVSLI